MGRRILQFCLDRDEPPLPALLGQAAGLQFPTCGQWRPRTAPATGAEEEELEQWRPLARCIVAFLSSPSVVRSVRPAKSRSGGGGGGAMRDRRIAVARAVEGRTKRVLRANKRAGMGKGCGRGCVMHDFAQFRHPLNKGKC